jgi:hypothetical protein
MLGSCGQAVLVTSRPHAFKRLLRQLYFPGMAKPMKANEAPSSEDVCLFCPQAIVTVSNALARLI